MQKILEKLCVISIIGLIIVIFLKEFIEFPFLLPFEVFLLVLVVFSCLSLAKGPTFYFSLIALIIGHLLFYKYEMGFSIWLDGITKNLPLAILFVMVPVLSIPLKEGGYLEAFNYYVGKYINKTRSLYSVLTGFLFCLGSITNLGSIRITHSLVEEVKFPAKFLAKVYAVGFASCIAWSPYFGSVNLVLYFTGVSFNEYVLYGLIYGLFILILGNLLFYKDISIQEEVRSSIKIVNKKVVSSNKIKELLFILFGLIIAVIIGEKIFDFSSMMFMVSLIAVIYAVIWSLSIKKFSAFLQKIKSYHNNILQVKNEVVFFLSVGFFGVILANTPIQHLIEKFFQGISGISIFLLVEFILILTVFLSSIGIHQVVTVTTLALSLKPHVLGFTDLTFALTLISAWTVAMIISPFVPFNIIAGGLLKENIFKISLKWNRSFGIVVIIFSGLYIVLVNIILTNGWG